MTCAPRAGADALRAARGAGTRLANLPSPLAGLMTNRGSVILALLILIAIGVDVVFYGTEHLVFLGKKLADLLEWIAFWR